MCEIVVAMAISYIGLFAPCSTVGDFKDPDPDIWEQYQFSESAGCAEFTIVCVEELYLWSRTVFIYLLGCCCCRWAWLCYRLLSDSWEIPQFYPFSCFWHIHVWLRRFRNGLNFTDVHVSAHWKERKVPSCFTLLPCDIYTNVYVLTRLLYVLYFINNCGAQAFLKVLLNDWTTPLLFMLACNICNIDSRYWRPVTY